MFPKVMLLYIVFLKIFWETSVLFVIVTASFYILSWIFSVYSNSMLYLKPKWIRTPETGCSSRQMIRNGIKILNSEKVISHSVWSSDHRILTCQCTSLHFAVYIQELQNWYIARIVTVCFLKWAITFHRVKEQKTS